nr:hypothetical protein [Tanacetum cinerariifolium]
MEVMQAYDANNELHIPLLQAPIASPTVLPPVLSIIDSQDFFPPKEISLPKDAKTPVESSIQVSPSSLVRSSSPSIKVKDSLKRQSGGDVFDLIGDVDPTDEDRDIGMGYSTDVLVSLGGEIFSRGKKCKRASEAKISLVKSFKKLEEVFPDEAGK